MEGWISLYRKFTEWEWYTDANTMRLFLHLLLKANHQDGNWQGKTIRRGQVVIGRKSLANELKISEQAIRTSLNKLKITNEITIETTNKFSIITIEKYDVYQDNQKENNQQKDQQATNEQPTSNQQLTTNNNNNNNNNIIVPIEIETTTNVNNIKIDTNRVKTVYGYDIKNPNLNDYIKHNLNNNEFIKIYEQYMFRLFIKRRSNKACN